MTNYTIADVKHIIPQELTGNQIDGVEQYINTGFIPPYDSCLHCEPATIRKLISMIQVAERNGQWPPKSESKTKRPATRDRTKSKANEPKDLDEGNYVADEVPSEELEEVANSEYIQRMFGGISEK